MKRIHKREADNYFSVISDFLDCYVVILGSDGKLMYYNSVSESIAEKPYNHNAERYYWDLFCLPEEKELCKAYFATLEPDKCPFELKTQMQKSDGSLETILWKVNAFYLECEESYYYALTGTDITSYDKTNNALQQIGEKYRTIIHVSPVAVMSMNCNYQVTSWSSATERLLGWTEKSALNKDIRQLLNDQDGLFTAYCNRALDGHIINDLELACKHRNGQEVIISLHISPMRHYNGMIDGLTLVALDITERKQAEEKIRYMSIHDQLTGLYNRHLLEEKLLQFELSEQYPLSIIIADLNGLKLVNDTYGHLTGDEMLKSAADIIKDSCSDQDIIARWGGDEFIILLPNTPVKDGELVQNRIIEKCEGACAGDIPISIALGLAVRVDTNVKISDVLREAEDNMYKQKLIASRSTRSTVLSTLLSTLAQKSYETEAHTRRMHEIAHKIGSEVGLAEVELNRLSLLITLHDIGKINISEEILTKQGKLTEEEWKTIRKHPEIGYRIARATEEFAHVAEDIAAHHEHWDGNGYPQGLKGEGIPLLARITTIADAYEVMSYGRPYKKAMNREEIIAEFKRCSGSQFDPTLVETFLSII
ncbi:MAG: sensor domain-containing diguanylate cyclase/phosphohydrolase [Bacillota bacterium]